MNRLEDVNMFVSIIVPIYNAEKYLEECIDSLIRQTYKNLEIILIDDGSTDSSKDICEAYSFKNANILTFHKQNGGVSSARNEGIRRAKGKYLMFVDSDDKVEENFVEKMVARINDNDCVICGYTELYVQTKIKKCYDSYKEYPKTIAIPKTLDRTVGGFSCNKIFKMELIKKYSLRFNEKIKMCEDLLFVTQYLEHCNKICILPETLYIYRMRKSSMTFKENDEKIQDIYRVYIELLKIYKTNKIEDIHLKYQIVNASYTHKKGKDAFKDSFNESLYVTYLKCLLSLKISCRDKIKLFIKKNFYFIYVKYLDNKKRNNVLFD